jgi:predicted nucleic acid-binding protein
VALTDIVLDTNVLAHADNRDNADMPHSRDLIAGLRRSSTALCFDEGFNYTESQNRSAIASEYFEHLPAGGLGLALVEECALYGRVSIVSTRVATKTNGAITRIVNDPTDRKFVKVAVNSTEHVLVTHDEAAFDDTAVEALAAELGVEAIDAYGCRPRV